MITKSQIEINLKSKFGNYLVRHGVPEEKIVDFASDQVAIASKPQCTRCFDKGYASTIIGTSVSPDFYGDHEYNDVRPRILYCDCARGKDLRGLIETNYKPL